MTEVTDPNAAAPAAPGEGATPAPEATPPANTNPNDPVQGDPAAVTPSERTVPYSALAEERKKRQDLAREIAELRGQQRLAEIDPNDADVYQHPVVQDLLLKQAKQELSDFARGILDTKSNIPSVIKKSILKNVRGFVNESTQDIETAKLDIQEFIESVEQEIVAEQAPKPKDNFVVAPSNASTIKAKETPAEVAKILAKPVEEWTDAEVATLERFKQK